MTSRQSNSESETPEKVGRSSPAGPAIRPGLIHRWIEMRHDELAVVRDLSSRHLFYFSKDEISLLKLADGSRTLDQIVEAARGVVFSPMGTKPIARENVRQFFANCRRNGLLVDQSGSAVRQSLTPAMSSLWRNPWTVRFPGWRPDPILAWLLPIARFAYGRYSLISAGCLIAICFLIVVTHLPAFSDDLVQASSAGTGSLILLAFAVGIAKMVHELSHALACKYHGAECREIGVMLLFGVPCLYADVTDAWLIRKASHRMMVSAAGMYAEVLVACLATLTWFFANAGPVREIAVALVFVCSVSTVLINGNPLLRYDGYYILVDWLGIPNLASKAATSLRLFFKQHVLRTAKSFGTSQKLGEDSESIEQHVWLSLYAIASWIYRVSIFAALGMVVIRLGRANDVEILAWLLVGIGILIFVSRISQARKRSLTVAVRDSETPVNSLGKQVSSFVRPAVILVVLSTIVMVPLPSHVVAIAMIEPADAVQIFASESGLVESSVDYGTSVSSDASLVKLRGFDLERKLSLASANHNTLEVKLQVARDSQQHRSLLAKQIPVIKMSIHKVREQEQALQRQIQSLQMRAPKAGVFYPRVDSRGRMTNVGEEEQGVAPGQWVQQGSSVGLVGDPRRRVATAYVLEVDLSKIHVGQRAHLLLADFDRGKVAGIVGQVDRSPADEVPYAVRIAAADGAAGTEASQWIDASDQNRREFYRVRLTLDSSADDLTVHRLARVQINVPATSIWQRFRELLQRTFG